MIFSYIFMSVLNAPDIEAGEFATWAAGILLLGMISLFGMLLKHLANQQKQDRAKIEELDEFQKKTLTNLVVESTTTLISNNNLMKEILKLLSKMS